MKQVRHSVVGVGITVALYGREEHESGEHVGVAGVVAAEQKWEKLVHVAGAAGHHHRHEQISIGIDHGEQRKESGHLLILRV